MSALKFTNEHECIKLDGDVAWVGITKYAQEALGDLVYVELPEIGKKVKKGQGFAVVESVKTAADVYSPVDGEVIAANDALPSSLDMITQPIDQGGWIAKIKIESPDQLAGLMDEAAYQNYLKSL